MMAFWRQIRHAAIEVLYPRTCAGCGLRGSWLCQRCEATVPTLRYGICYRCGGPATSGACRLCRQLAPQILQARAAYPYVGWVRDAVHSFKYHGAWDRGDDLAARMVGAATVFGELDYIVPIPLHTSRFERRGYNQAEILSYGIASRLRGTVVPALQRTRETSAQAMLGQDDRHRNMDHAFALNPDWSLNPGARILIVDDVRTTCATLNDASRELMRTGPSAIYVLTFALDIPASILDPWLADYL